MTNLEVDTWLDSGRDFGREFIVYIACGTGLTSTEVKLWDGPDSFEWMELSRHS